jgi:hypothetical protein
MIYSKNIILFNVAFRYVTGLHLSPPREAGQLAHNIPKECIFIARK